MSDEQEFTISQTVEAPRATIRRLDHIGVVVDDLAAARSFFGDLGLRVEGESRVGGDWVDKVVGLRDVHADVVMMQTPDGLGKLELTKFHAPADDEGPRPSQANRLGIRHLAFLVDDLDDVLERLGNQGFGTVGDVADYEDVFRLCYVSGPEGIIVELAEQRHSTTESPTQA
jgi:catechol 2,3-dioxygenase-like lactoylglutathione lyase family enzyme